MKNKKTILTIVVVLILDIISKLLISNLMLEEQSIKIINNFFYLTYAKNTGVAFSFFEGNIPFIIIITIILYIVTKDKKLVLKLTSEITILSSMLTIIISIVLSYMIKNSTSTINLSVIANTIQNKFIFNSLILMSLGFIELSFVKILK